MAPDVAVPGSWRTYARLVAILAVCLCFTIGWLREQRMLRPSALKVILRYDGPLANANARTHHSKRRKKSGSRRGPVGTEAMRPAERIARNRTTFVLPNGHCLQRATVLPSLSCSLPECNATRTDGRLLVLTNGETPEWASYLRFELGQLRMRSGAQLVDIELQLTGTGLCHRRFNFTHQLHLLRSHRIPAALTSNGPHTRRLAAQWSRMSIGENFRIPLNLNDRQLLTLAKNPRLNLAITEKLFDSTEDEVSVRCSNQRARCRSLCTNVHTLPRRETVGPLIRADACAPHCPQTKQPSKTIDQTCSYYSSSTRKGAAAWPKLQISYTWRCCGNDGHALGDTGAGKAARRGGAPRAGQSARMTGAQVRKGGGQPSEGGINSRKGVDHTLARRLAEYDQKPSYTIYTMDGSTVSSLDRESGTAGGASAAREGDQLHGDDDTQKGEGEGGSKREHVDDSIHAHVDGSMARGGIAPHAVRPPWITRRDWLHLSRAKQIAMPWHSRLPDAVPPWVYQHSNDAQTKPCHIPANRDEASGGQLGVPHGERPEVSFIIAYVNNENMTAQCLTALWSCSSELPSAEYLVIDDGSTETTGELRDTLQSLAIRFGIRYELVRYPVSVGFTMATTEAAQRANGTYLMFLNNDAFVRKWALRAMHDTFSVHADVGAVGAKLVGKDDKVQEAGAIIWADASGAWFNKYQPLYRGRRNEVNHRLNYLRETDYVSAAVVMLSRDLFLSEGMFDVHFSPGYYEDTDLSFTVRARGLRVLYVPFAHVVHQPHSTYQSSMDHLLERNKAQFASKWAGKLLDHMPPCNVASACWSSKATYTHLAATRMYTYRMLWMDMVLPEPDRDSGSVRTLTMLKIFLAMRCHVSIVSVQRSGNGRHERYTRMLQYLGIHVIPSFKMLQTLHAREPYDFIVVARRDTYKAARELLHRYYPSTLLVADTVDLHFMRERARHEFIRAHANDPELLGDIFGAGIEIDSLLNSTDQARLRQLELDFVEASSVAIVVSDAERRVLKSELKAEGRDVPAIVVVANAHEPVPPTLRPRESRHGIVFVGNFNHLPNRDAVLYFAREVLPRALRVNVARMDTQFAFHIVGANAIPPAVLELNGSRLPGDQHSRVFVHGYVPKLRPLYAQMRVSVAPLRWGAGVKGKVNTAHQLGVPVVATPMAVEGMHAVHGEHVLLGQTPTELASAVLQAYYNDTVWRQLAHHGPMLVETRFSASRAATGLLTVLAHLRDANTLMGMKSLALGSARPRIYSDLRAAAALGGYYFNLTNLAPHLDFTDEALPDNYTCTADGIPTAPTTANGAPRAAHAPGEAGGSVLQRVAAAGF